MGQRVYTTFFDNISVAAIQDLFSIKAGAANGVELHQLDLTAGGVTSPAEFRILLKRAATAATLGTGGTVPTISPTDSGDTKAATAVVHANDITTQLTSTGTLSTLEAFQWNVLMPFQYLPAPEDREVCQAAEAFSFFVPAAPGAAVLVSGTIKWRELP
jgi:hypothetical protein